MKIHITEHKSVGALRPNNVVRVFVDDDYNYGYFVAEDELHALLNVEQRQAYLAANYDVKLEVEPKVAQRLIDLGVTPYAKRQVA